MSAEKLLAKALIWSHQTQAIHIAVPMCMNSPYPSGNSQGGSCACKSPSGIVHSQYSLEVEVWFTEAAPGLTLLGTSLCGHTGARN